MKPLILALRYMDILYNKKEPHLLMEILDERCAFSGPLYHFHSAADYIDSLKKNPPDGFGFDLIRSYEDENTACLVYQFHKPGIRTPMAQFFEVRNDKILKILLIFDSALFRPFNNPD